MSDADFKMWAELAEGDEGRQLVPIGEAAAHLGVPPGVIVKIALALKRRSNNENGRPALWLMGVPYFSVADVSRMEVLVKRADAIEAQSGGN